jgi:hypothetical protein
MELEYHLAMVRVFHPVIVLIILGPQAHIAYMGACQTVLWSLVIYQTVLWSLIMGALFKCPVLSIRVYFLLYPLLALVVSAIL